MSTAPATGIATDDEFEPLLLLADSAVVGHLGTAPLAALGLSSNVLTVLVGLSIFLAYSTTGTVARRLGAGDRLAALNGGLDGLVLANLDELEACVATEQLLVVGDVVGERRLHPAHGHDDDPHRCDTRP